MTKTDLKTVMDALNVKAWPTPIPQDQRIVLEAVALVQKELERSDEPVAIRHSFDGYGWLYIDNGHGSGWIGGIDKPDAEFLYAHPPLSKEHVAWTDENVIAWCIARGIKAAAPQERKPLSDDAIWKSDAIMAANSGYGATFETLREVVRAVEAAHNIGATE